MPCNAQGRIALRTSLGGKRIASSGQTRAQESHPTRQLSGLMTSGRRGSPSILNTPWLQYSTHLPQPSHLFRSTVGYHGTCSRGMPYQRTPISGRRPLVSVVSNCSIAFSQSPPRALPTLLDRSRGLRLGKSHMDIWRLALPFAAVASPFRAASNIAFNSEASEPESVSSNRLAPTAFHFKTKKDTCGTWSFHTEPLSSKPFLPSTRSGYPILSGETRRCCSRLISGPTGPWLRQPKGPHLSLVSLGCF